MDFKVVDSTTKAELFFEAQGANNHTQLGVHFCVVDGEKQHDFCVDHDELYFIGVMINKMTGFDIIDLCQVEKMKQAEEKAWKEERERKLNK